MGIMENKMETTTYFFLGSFMSGEAVMDMNRGCQDYVDVS